MLTTLYMVELPAIHRPITPITEKHDVLEKSKKENQLTLGIVSDSSNIFLWHESEDIHMKSLFPKF